MRPARAVFIAIILLAGCASQPAAQPGDPERGRQLFNTPVESPRGPQPECARCHAIKEGERAPMGIGTNLHDIGSRAGAMVQGQSAEDYLRTAIVDPDAFLAGGFQDGLMYREYEKVLTPQQINDLIAYMMTLKK